ncbi:HlyD family efflux transporter periplasmic adaptor subunit [Nostoc sp. UHCC 0302]|uniref:HlyD family efflux transporter periplasmic adaptor subunit n=1 Tax=Nostoc sp. UHCC 0302 TaxID=3134896 RepID=UPI00311C8BCE
MPSQYRNSSSAIAKTEDEKTTVSKTDDANNWSYSTEELLDALPKVWTRSLLYALVGFTAIALPWAMLSKVDETGSARGSIEPQGATLKLDSQTDGRVTSVRVKEGDKVKAGQILLDIESNILQTQLQEAEAKLSGLQNQRSQFDILKNQLQLSVNVQEQQNQSQALEKMSQVNQAKQNLDAKQSTYNLQKLEKQALVNQAQQQIKASQDTQKSARSRLSIDSRQVERFRKLTTDGAVSATQVDELQKEQEESKQVYEKAISDVKQSQLRLIEEQNRYQTTLNQLESDIKQAKLRLQEEENSYRSLQQTGTLALLRNQQQLKDLQTKIAALESQIAQAKSQIVSLKLQLQQRIVRSPVDGMIFDLPIDKPGSVVQPGQRIAQIAPENTPLILKAEMPSTQSGFLKEGMPVKIKFDAYPFQDYGVVPGRLDWVSPDSKVTQSNRGNTQNFELKISLARPYIQSRDKRILLTPGQTATAEVIIRQRHLIDYILDPFKKLQTGGLEL